MVNRGAIWVLLLLLGMPGYGQWRLTGESLEAARDVFEKPDMARGKCQAFGFTRFTYSLRNIRLVRLQINADQLMAGTRAMSMISRARAVGSTEWQYFANPVRFQPLPEERRNLAVFGTNAIVAGKGEYEQESLFLSPTGGGCRARWKFRVGAIPKQTGDDVVVEEGKLLTQGESLELGLKRPVTRKGELLVVLNVGQDVRNRTRVRRWEQSTLQQALLGLVERVRYERVRVIGVSLQQQAQFYESVNFGPEQIGDLADAIEQLELGTIDASKLRRKAGPQELLAEVLEPKGAQAAVVLGLTSLLAGRPIPELVERMKGYQGRIYYLNLTAPLMLDDVFEGAVKRAGGRTLEAILPTEYAKVLAKLDGLLGEERPGSPGSE